MSRRHQRLAAYLLVFVATTNGTVAADATSSALAKATSFKATSSLSTSDAIDNVPELSQTSNQSDKNTSILFDGIPQRALVYKVDRNKHPTHRSPAASVSRWKCSSSRGPVRNYKGCESYQFTIFIQRWIPAVSYTDGKRYSRSSEQAKYWNENLMMHGLRPVTTTIPRDANRWTREAQDEIDQKEWPNLSGRKDFYEQEWNQYGKKSGLNPLEYVQEIHHIHKQFHPTKMQIKLPVQRTITLSALQQTFKRHAFLICKEKEQQQYFYEVRFCHPVSPRTHRAEPNIVDYTNCEPRPQEVKCTQDVILVTHETYGEENTSEKCSSSPDAAKHEDKDSGTYKYIAFAQAWLPGVSYAYGKNLSRSSAEAENWNKNLQIHGLWPQTRKIAVDTPWPKDIQGAINETEWPNVGRKDLYQHEWNDHGRKSGFTPLEFVREIHRVHQFHRTPTSILQTRFIDRETLRDAFHSDAYLVCQTKRKEKKQFFFEVRYCHQVDPKTHHATRDVVDYFHCGGINPQQECREKEIRIDHEQYTPHI